MIAQVKTSLTIGEQYHFQVQAADKVIHLKVLGEPLKGEESVNIKSLLQQLGLKKTKSNISLLQSLIREKIPFDIKQLVQAFQVLDGAKNTPLTGQVLKEMIAAKLPMTNAVFEALLSQHTSGFTAHIRGLQHALVQHNNDSQLSERLGQLVERPLDSKAALTKQILAETQHNNPHFFNLLKAAGAISSSIDFTMWQTQWEAFTAQNKKMLQHTHNQQLSVALPFQMDSEVTVSSLEQLISNQNELRHHSQEMMQLWHNKLTHGSIDQPALTRQEFAVLKQGITQQILPLLSGKSQQQLASHLQYNTADLRQVLEILETLNDKQALMKAADLMTKIQRDSLFFQASAKDQFLTQLNQVLRSVGLTYENQLLHTDIEQRSTTIKGMLLQMLQKGDGTVQEQAQQLLHFINGMQINAVNETNHFIQANLQIPGERLELTNDIELEFEGNKTSNGEINPDYCRVVFYLNLAHLQQTIVDMHIHNRLVTVTVYNDATELGQHSLPLQPMLKQGLANLDYQLSGISFKPLKDRAKQGSILPQKTTAYPPNKGVDYRV